jgi:hypothetical protein
MIYNTNADNYLDKISGNYTGIVIIIGSPGTGLPWWNVFNLLCLF